ncbi:kinesin-like protein KIF26B [Ischnura elegans]|uniref:kinesin-like protein KIF26B n=1 Tax=Ischnura elegans TaxID=197161 RepID=UPI001ED8A48D|nr:kinesin-like protein KIF26B [Ischnura elegans]
MEPSAGNSSPDPGSTERAAQKLNLSSSPHRRKRHSSGEDESTGPAVAFRTDYGGIVHRSPPPVPPALLRRIGVREVSGVGKALLTTPKTPSFFIGPLY